MGNKPIVNYSLTMFTQDISNNLNTNKPNLNEIKNALTMLKKVFLSQPGVFENAKILEKESIKSVGDSNQSSVLLKNNKMLGHPLPDKPTINFVKNLSLIPRILCNSSINDELFPDCFNLFLDMFDFLGKEKAFLEFLFLNGLDVLSNLLINHSNELSYELINRTVNYLREVLMLKVKSPKYFNLNSLLKLLHINALMLNASYTSHEENLLVISKYTKAYFVVITSLRDGLFSKRVKHKEAKQLIITVHVSLL